MLQIIVKTDHRKTQHLLQQLVYIRDAPKTLNSHAKRAGAQSLQDSSLEVDLGEYTQL